MDKKVRIGAIIIAVVIGVVFSIQYVVFNAQKNSRADTAPTISLSIENGTNQKIVIVKAKSSGAVNIINYNFHVLFNAASTVTDITYLIGAASAGLGDSNSNLSAVNARTGTNRYIKIFGELGSSTPAPLASSYQEVVRITFDTNQTGTMISIPNDTNFTFTAYNSTTFVNTSLVITGGPFFFREVTASSSSSSSSISSRPSQSSSSSTGRSSTATPEPVKSNGDLLNINSSPLDRAPFRYEQQVALDKGTYILKASALIYMSRGRGVLVALACAENDCGNGKTLNAIIAQTPIFSVSPDYKEQSIDINIPDAGNNKKYVVRIFSEDGSEADFDYVSLTNQWDGEQLQNIHFAQTQDTSISRKHPQSWEMDAAGKLYSTVDPNKGVQGALYINSISRL